MRQLPPLAQLRAFEAAARHLSFKQAAGELGVTPTAISHQIRALELYCGQSLFRRRPRPLALTEAGAKLYPIVREGLDGFAVTVQEIRADTELQPLRVTTTNAFASRWLVPRLPNWRAANPNVSLEVIGTDQVLDLWSGEADLAIRYMYDAPSDLVAQELFRDEFMAVCSPALLPDGKPLKQLGYLKEYTAIHCYWAPSDRHAPTWERWLNAARSIDPDAPLLNEMRQLSFREELHAIEAALAGQGIAISSDVLVGNEVDAGTMTKVATPTIPGYGYYVVHPPNSPRQLVIDAFREWARSVR